MAFVDAQLVPLSSIVIRRTVPVPAMPRFFFDYRAGDAFYRDDVGLEFETVGQAVREAKQAIGEATADALKSADSLSLIIDIRSETGEVVHSLVSVATVLPTIVSSTTPTGDLPAKAAG